MLTSTGRPELQALEGATRDALTQMHSDLTSLDASEISYTPSDPTKWVAPLPRTLQEATDRLAASGGVVPVP